MLIYFVRHGESYANKNKVHNSPKVELTEEGIRQAGIVGDRLKKHSIDKIYSSPLTRAHTTAEIIGKIINLDIQSWDALKERQMPSANWGKGNSDKEAKKIDQIALDLFVSENGKHSDEESFIELIARGNEVLNNLKNHPEDSTILCVSHDTMIKTLVAIILNGSELTAKEFEHLRHHLRSNNTGITIFEYTEKRGWSVNVWNDTAHL